MKLIRWPFYFLLGGSLVAAEPTSAEQPLTLAQTVETVLAHFPALDAAQGAVDAARGRSLQSQSSRLPQISAGGDYTYMSLRPYVDFSGPDGTSRLYESINNSYDATVHLSQLLTDFGRTDALVALAKAGELSARDALEQVRQQLGYQTIQVFYGILLWRESVAVADEEIQALQEALRVTEDRVKNGKATKFDILTTQVRLATAQNLRADRVAALEKQEAFLRDLLGCEPGAPVRLSGDFDAPPDLPNLGAAIREGLQNRPEIHLARDTETEAGLRLDATRRAGRPLLTAQATAGVEDGMLPAMYGNKGYVSAGLAVSLPVFTGRRITGERVEARGLLRAAQDRSALAARAIAEDVEQALADLKKARAHLASADLLVEQAKEALSLARLRYENGIVTNLELLDAQSHARTAELTRLQARYDCVLASYALARAAGRPPLASGAGSAP